MFKNKSRDISEKDFQRHNKACRSYQQPSPQYSPKPSELEKLAYVATVFNQKPESSFNHSDTSPFQSVTPSKR